jgi:glycine cleavage system H lipoate-binding protein
MEHEFLSTYVAKNFEYLLAIGYLLLFIPFWKYVQGGTRPAAELAHAAARHAEAKPAARAAHAGAAPLSWFQVPAGIHLHPGHTWARLEPDGLVAVGADDFAHKLVGAAKVELPALGARVAQGEPAFQIGDGEKDVPMLSPIDGTVVAVNQAVKERADGLDEPYGRGWLFKVKAPRLAANLRQLLQDGAARRFMEDAEARISMALAPELGRVLQDGGVPVHGIARALSGDQWDDLARQYFLT